MKVTVSGFLATYVQRRFFLWTPLPQKYFWENRYLDFHHETKLSYKSAINIRYIPIFFFQFIFEEAV